MPQSARRVQRACRCGSAVTMIKMTSRSYIKYTLKSSVYRMRKSCSHTLFSKYGKRDRVKERERERKGELNSLEIDSIQISFIVD